MPSAADTVAVGENEAGVVSGFYTDSSGSDRGFIDRDGAFAAIDEPDAGTASSQGTSVGYINDFGQVAGSYTESNDNTVAFAGPLGRLTTVSDPLAPPFSTLTAAVNDAGVVAGEDFDASEVVHGFELSPACETSVPVTGYRAKPGGPGAQGTRQAHRRAAALLDSVLTRRRPRRGAPGSPAKDGLATLTTPSRVVGYYVMARCIHCLPWLTMGLRWC